MAGGQDIAFTDVGTDCPDLKLVDGDLLADNGLENAVLISLFTNRYVPSEDLPPNVESNEGWWADGISDPADDRIGSRLWVFDRVGKINTDTRNGMVDACEEALEWMIEDGIAKSVSVSGEVVFGERIDLSIEIVRPDAANNFFQFVWDGQEMKRLA